MTENSPINFDGWYLSFIFAEKWTLYADRVTLCRKSGAQLNALSRLQHLLDESSKMALVRSFVSSHFQYCPLIWHFCGSKDTQKLERIQLRALRLVFNDRTSGYETLLNKANTVVAEMFVGLKFRGFLFMDGSWSTQIRGKPPKPS